MLNLATLRVRCIMPQGTRAFLIHSRKKLRGTGIVDDLASRDMRCSIMRRLTHTWVCKIIQFAWSVDRKIDMKACSAVSGQTLTLVCYNPPTWQSGSWLDTLTLSVTGPYLAYKSTGTNGEAQIIHKTQQTKTKTASNGLLSLYFWLWTERLESSWWLARGNKHRNHGLTVTYVYVRDSNSVQVVMADNSFVKSDSYY